MPTSIGLSIALIKIQVLFMAYAKMNIHPMPIDTEFLLNKMKRKIEEQICAITSKSQKFKMEISLENVVSFISK